MKFLILSLALIAVAAAQQHAQQPPIAILRQSQDVSPDGAYNYQYETQNGIVMAERGALGPASAITAQGQFQYTAPDGTPIAVSYTADENGFQPQGAHLPVAPPIPEAILRSLEHNAAHPEENDSQPPQQQFNRRF